MRVSLGAEAARRNVDETITGLWTFANVLGLLTDIIGERTAAAGVTVDGLLIRDAGIPEAAVTAHEAALAILESQITDGSILARLAGNEIITGNWRFDDQLDIRASLTLEELANAAALALNTLVTADAVNRFRLQADGLMQWGDGTGAVDTNLFRDSANTLKTDDGFRVGGSLRPMADLILSERAMSLSLGVDNDDVDTGTVTIQRIPTVTSGTEITGFAGGAAGRIIMVQSAASVALPINDEDAGSVAANRIIGPQGSIISLAPDEGVMFWYDSTSSRWRTLSLTA